MMRAFCLTLCLIFFQMGGGLALGDDAAETAGKINQLQASIAALKKRIDQFTGKQERLKKELRSAEQEIAGSLQRVSEARKALSRLESELKQLETRARSLEQQRDSQQQAIRLALRDAYKQGKQNRLKLILNQQDPGEVERLLKYYEIISSARQQKIDQYLQTLKELADSKAAQVQARNRMKVQASALEQEHSVLEAAQQKREAAIAELDQQIGSAAKKLASQEMERDKLQGLLNEIEREVASIQIPFEGMAFGERKGKMSWPVDGKRLNRFGGRKSGSSVRWQGVLIAANQGDDIRAVHDGRVVYADWFSSQGLMVLIDHGGRYMSLYAHNASILKQTGDLVAAGEVIATVGNSGGQAETGLYFEIRSKGKPVNPAQWCR